MANFQFGASDELPDRVSLIATLALYRENSPWPYAKAHSTVIDEHWVLARKTHPAFFNGTIHVLTRLIHQGDHVEASCIATEFKNFLYWRDEGYPANARVRDGFGSALIRSREGYIILGRQRAGNINEGLAYLPGGFIDARDVGADGMVDIRASVAREVSEETGLGADTLHAQDGFLMCEASVHVSFAVPYVCTLNAAEIVERIAAHIAQDPASELVDVVVLKERAAMKGLGVPHYARVLLSSPLAWT